MQHTGLSIQLYRQTSLVLQCQLDEPLLRHSTLPCTQTISPHTFTSNWDMQRYRTSRDIYQLWYQVLQVVSENKRLMGQLSYDKIHSYTKMRNNTAIYLSFSSVRSNQLHYLAFSQSSHHLINTAKLTCHICDHSRSYCLFLPEYTKA